jgi:UDP-N-acetylmuramate dehydrogenase
MILNEALNKLEKFGLKKQELLAPYTTWKIGGPAEYLIETKNAKDLLEVLKISYEYKIPVTLLGKGSNILISDQGIEGLVVINKSKNINLLDNSGYLLDAEIEKESKIYDYETPYIEHRHFESGDKEFYSFEDLDFQESGKRKLVKMDSGLFLPLAISWCLKNNLSGLQWFAGIPGSIGGSLYNNIHGGTHHFSEYFNSSKIFIPKTDKVAITRIKELNGKNLNQILQETENYIIAIGDFDFFEFGYDQSFIRRKDNQVIVLEVILSLFESSDKQIEKAKFSAKEWAKRKRLQPQKSCGSVFQALKKEDQDRLNIPVASSGYIIDKIFNWRGKVEGGAQISEKHGNFIINKDNAKAEDVLSLINQIQERARKELDLEMVLEINLLGF